ncbi:MAG: hypothetical protein WD875_11680 [Pirellulales bacterium]
MFAMLMTGRRRRRWLAVLLMGILIGAIGHAVLAPMQGQVLARQTTKVQAPAQQAPAAQVKPAADLAALAAEIETIKGKLPDQSHAMQDVGYHFTNLWFAGQKENWDLANFYWSETRSHLRWAVRIIPIRKDNAGKEVDLPHILEAVENSPLKQLQEAIVAKDTTAFDKAYRFMVESCYACHKAADKPYLRPRIPDAPEVHVIGFEPKADWPQ